MDVSGGVRGCGLIVAVLLLTASDARADVILNVGNIPQSDENVLLTNGAVGDPVLGQTAQTGFSVAFGSSELLTSPASGQARIQATDALFTSLDITVPGGSFTSLTFNIIANANGTVDFTAVNTAGDVFQFNNVAVTGAGSNFFTFTTTLNQRIASVALFADTGVAFESIAQVRIGGTQSPQQTIPEPAAATLVALGLLAAGRSAWRRRGR